MSIESEFKLLAQKMNKFKNGAIKTKDEGLPLQIRKPIISALVFVNDKTSLLAGIKDDSVTLDTVFSNTKFTQFPKLHKMILKTNFSTLIKQIIEMMDYYETEEMNILSKRFLGVVIFAIIYYISIISCFVVFAYESKIAGYDSEDMLSKADMDKCNEILETFNKLYTAAKSSGGIDSLLMDNNQKCKITPTAITAISNSLRHACAGVDEVLSTAVFDEDDSVTEYSV